MPSIDLHVDTLMTIVHERRWIELRDDPHGAHFPPRQLDAPRMRDGRLDAAVFSIFVTPYWEGDRAAARARWLIDTLDHGLARPAVHAALRRVNTIGELEEAGRAGACGAFIGIEGGHAIADSLERLREFADRGVRYMTLTWSNANGWADSSGSPPVHGGLTQFGRRVVREMEALGVLVDVSHVADTTFWDAVECASAPIIASHSACRALAAHPRNLTDAQLRAVADSGGVVGIPFHSSFLESGTDAIWSAPWRRGGPFSAPATLELADRRSRPLSARPPARLESLVAHLLHALEVAGDEHVALGTDYDGMILPPRGLEDVSGIPILRSALAAAGVAEGTLGAIWGGNVVRVFEDAERRRVSRST